MSHKMEAFIVNFIKNENLFPNYLLRHQNWDNTVVGLINSNPQNMFFIVNLLTSPS